MLLSDSLYVIGGHDGTQSLNTVEVLDHPSGSWKPGPPLTTPRANTKAVVTAGSVIYAIGGFNGNQFLDTIELLESGGCIADAYSGNQVYASEGCTHSLIIFWILCVKTAG